MTSKLTLEFFYDFGSPNAYFAHKVLKNIKDRTELVINTHPVLIGGIFKLTHNQPPWMASANCSQKMTYIQDEIRRFIKDNNLTAFKFNSAFPVNTLLSMRTAIAAKKTGVHDIFMDCVFEAMWEFDQNISEPSVLKTVLDNAGLNGEALVASATDIDIKQTLMTNTENAVERGLFGLPSFIYENELYFGKDQLLLIEAKINRKNSAIKDFKTL